MSNMQLLNQTKETEGVLEERLLEGIEVGAEVEIEIEVEVVTVNVILRIDRVVEKVWNFLK